MDDTAATHESLLKEATQIYSYESITVICNPLLPSNTMMVGKDLYEVLSNHPFKL